jgi:RNA polymerase-binding transcription factor DksA
MKSAARFKEVLTKEKEKLEGELVGVGRKNPANSQDWEPTPPPGSEGTLSDPLDIAERTTDFDINASIVADLETRYNEVTSALDRIEEGTYGTCVVSGEPIEEARLTADPAARTCLKHLNQ